MSDLAAGVIGFLLCLVLVGSAVLARRRRGEPIGRHAMTWAAIFAGAFAAAILIDRHC